MREESEGMIGEVDAYWVDLQAVIAVIKSKHEKSEHIRPQGVENRASRPLSRT